VAVKATYQPTPAKSGLGARSCLRHRGRPVRMLPVKTRSVPRLVTRGRKTRPARTTGRQSPKTLYCL
jgi:hypothetical protein